MPSIFSRIIQGELPGRFVWRDDLVVAFLTIAPLRPGHTLIVPIEEVDHWLDCEPELMNRLTTVAHKVGRAVQEAFSPVKVGLMIAGLEVAHTHLHIVPISGLQDLDFANADANPDPTAMDAAAEKIRAALRSAGHPEAA